MPLNKTQTYTINYRVKEGQRGPDSSTDGRLRLEKQILQNEELK